MDDATSLSTCRYGKPPHIAATTAVVVESPERGRCIGRLRTAVKIWISIFKTRYKIGRSANIFNPCNASVSSCCRMDRIKRKFYADTWPSLLREVALLRFLFLQRNSQKASPIESIQVIILLRTTTKSLMPFSS